MLTTSLKTKVSFIFWGVGGCFAIPHLSTCNALFFCSAKQALSGAEEGWNVTSTLSTDVEMRQVPSTYNSIPLNGSGFVRSCEPIVEEPATPEAEWNEVTESDMEDAFSKDPEDIPTINLNLQKFTQNECSYMHENMELQEYDLSKALVTLHPNVGSIPAVVHTDITSHDFRCLLITSRASIQSVFQDHGYGTCGERSCILEPLQHPSSEVIQSSNNTDLYMILIESNDDLHSDCCY